MMEKGVRERCAASGVWMRTEVGSESGGGGD